MSPITLHLSESLQKFVEIQAAELGISHPEEYLEKLLLEEQKRKIEEYYMKKIEEGLASGESMPMDEKFWEGVRAEVRQRRGTEKITGVE